MKGKKVAIEQGLAFLDVANTDPKCLTKSQIKNFNQNGFISPVNGFSAAGATANKSYFDMLMSQIKGEQSYAINCYQARLRGLWDICTNSVLLDHVEDLIGPDIVCWASHFFCKSPHDPKKVPWHQDASFWHLSPTRTVTIWLAIDDADEENSAMQFLPATHRSGSLPTEKIETDTVLGLQTAGIEDTGSAFSNNLKAGQFSLHADMLIHGSAPNSSDRRRCGLTIRYCPPCVRITHQEWAEGIEAIICRGADPDGYWQHHDRPAVDRLVLDKAPVNVGGN